MVEVFEWVSQDAIAGAHHNPVVLDVHGFGIPLRVNPC
jgi:hypothetical protein